jgi:hypothetical protein
MEDPGSAAVFHDRLDGAPFDSAQTARLPGTRPEDPSRLIVVDEAYSAQMRLRDRLIAERRAEVVGALDEAAPAVAELWDTILARLDARGDFLRDVNVMRRPDGVAVALDRASPEATLATLGRLVTEDLCLLAQRPGQAEHRLVAAVLCFPSLWTLHEKLGMGLSRIHAPVPVYGDDLAARVQRLFDALPAGRMLVRFNALSPDTPALHTPRTEAEAHATHAPTAGAGHWLRSERQCLLRLPRTGAVLFSIQTRMLPRGALTQRQAAAWDAHSEGRPHAGVAQT